MSIRVEREFGDLSIIIKVATGVTVVSFLQLEIQNYTGQLFLR